MTNKKRCAILNLNYDRGALGDQYPIRKNHADVVWEKGSGAEENGLAKSVSGSAEKIRPVVAEMRRAIFSSPFDLESDLFRLHFSVERDMLSAACLFFVRIKEKIENTALERIKTPIMKKTVFQGAATALITPFRNNAVDYETFGRLIDWQISEGIDALVVCGTTGESSTLTDEEHREAIRFAVKRVAGRVPVIAGTGSNDTAYAIELTAFACEAGADAVLLVTPYYNKTTQQGLIASFRAIADVSTKPVILYNVPSRTGCNILPETALALAEHPNIVAIKEAGGNISQIAELAALTKGKLDIYSGNDDQIVPILSLGGKGVISVLSNPMPRATSEICHRFFRGDVKGSLDLQLQLLPLVHALFCEVNPISVKAAMSEMGFGENTLRLPLTPMEEQHKERLLQLMREQHLI